jgi:3-dehydroquinate dehydratase-2
LDDINMRLQATGRAAGAQVDCFQSNHEGALVERIHAARGQYAFIIINPAAFTHTSVALRDALTGVAIPFVEVHISNVHARESFRQHSYLSAVAVGTVVGLGSRGYDLALRYALGEA